jgi:hypothetical protein
VRVLQVLPPVKPPVFHREQHVEGVERAVVVRDHEHRGALVASEGVQAAGSLATSQMLPA